MNRTQMTTMTDLIAKIREADTDYYKHDRPKLTDRDYDALVDQLQELERETGIVLSSSPTQSASGDILEELTPVTHSKPMLSAAKTKSVENLIHFAGDHSVLLSWKLDGLTLVLWYEHGELQQAITRGRNGLVGEDVTHTVRIFLNVPLSVPFQELFELRGEGVVSWENFKKLNSSLEEPYSHPRNLAAGSVRKLDPNESRKRHLEFIAFDLVTELGFRYKQEQLDFLKEQGFSVVPYVRIPEHGNAETIRDLLTLFDPELYAYPVDGIIVEYNDVRYGQSLGATGHHENRLIAYKWQDELYEAHFIGVELATTRTGMVSITGLFEPVEIDGTTVSRAYLHNVDIFDAFQFGAGDTIRVYKSNMIIPQITENLDKTGTYRLPATCPCCGSRLEVRETTGGTRQLFCENPHCTAKLVQRFTHFCEKTRMNIEGLSDTTLEKFIGHGWIRNFGDIYDLSQHREEIVRTEGFGVKSYERLMASIEKSRHCTLAQFIAGLGIPTVGRTAGRIISRHFAGDWDAFEEALQSGFDFRTLPDFGETMHNTLYRWYADPEEAKLWRPLLNKIHIVKENITMNTTTNSNPFAGKTVVATGKLENYTRDGIQMKLLSLGANPASSVSKKTDYLIVGEKAGSKLAKAQALGVKTLTEEEFEAMLA